MTAVRRTRQRNADVPASTRAPAAKNGDRSRQQARSLPASGPGKLARVRLQDDELKALDEVMRTLRIESTSEALREGLRLLAREAAGAGAAEQIRAFYAGRPARVPEGVAPVSEAELAAVDEMRW
jgi:hypothetical protein